MKTQSIIISILGLVLGFTLVDSVRYHRQMKDYQIELHMDTVWIYDRGRLIDMFIHPDDKSWHNQYDEVFLKDNALLRH